METAIDCSAGRRVGVRTVVAVASVAVAVGTHVSSALAEEGGSADDESDVEVIEHSGEADAEDEGSDSERESESEGESDGETIEHVEQGDPDSEEGGEDESSGDGSGVETIQHGGESETGEGEDETSDVESIQHGESDESETESESRGDSGGTDGSSEFSIGYGTGVWVDTGWAGDGEDIAEWRVSLDLELEQQLSSSWSALARGELRHWMGGEENPDETDLLVNATEPRAEADVRLGETYALYQSDRWAVRAGHLRTPWGSTSLIRPGDVVNPIDATAFAESGADSGRLLPQPTLEVSYVRPRWSLTGLIVPFFVPNRVTLFGRDSAVASAGNSAIGSGVPVGDLFSRLLDESVYEEAQPLLASPSRPDERPVNASLGARAAGTRWNTDFGLGYFWGWDRTPWLSVDPSVRELGRLAVEDGQVLRDFDLQGFIARNPEALDTFEEISDRRQEGEQLVEVDHRRLHSLVANVGRYVGPVGLRADVTLQPERTFVTEELRTVRRPTIFGVAGATYEEMFWGRPFVATVEGFWLQPFGEDAGVTRLFVGPDERRAEGGDIAMFEGGYRGLAGAVNWALPFWALELRVGGIVELDAGGVVFNGRLSRRWASWCTTSLGVAVFEGPDPSDSMSLGGLYDRNDRIGLRIQGAF